MPGPGGDEHLRPRGRFDLVEQGVHAVDPSVVGGVEIVAEVHDEQLAVLRESWFGSCAGPYRPVADRPSERRGSSPMTRPAIVIAHMDGLDAFDDATLDRLDRAGRTARSRTARRRGTTPAPTPCSPRPRSSSVTGARRSSTRAMLARAPKLTHVRLRRRHGEVVRDRRGVGPRPASSPRGPAPTPNRSPSTPWR